MSILSSDDFSSSISVGVSEKNADSAADTNATNTSSTSMMAIEIPILKEKGFTRMLNKAEE
jgi:hypothetical protein